ncbi:ATP-dependent helicase HrpB [Ostreococcus tauri]|uniref:ATP-dependent helicase HrpB n=1 Tax=Ostreococcus tauri TaxID=70448 RepID=A0A1Y5IDP3_OSTTA|nr:ATP-dependent helicase HrpB [Ostreococcus tauri]
MARARATGADIVLERRARASGRARARVGRGRGIRASSGDFSKNNLERIRDAASSLPIGACAEDVLKALDGSRCVVAQAPPGAGKTTVIPLLIAAARADGWSASRGDDARAGHDGRRGGGKTVLVLEPRRLAARAAATRMAATLGEKVGESVGYAVRFERKASSRTVVEVVTEGVLMRRLRRDPELAGVGAVIFDEFHERHLDGDLALALCREAQRTIRPDLRLLVMSATLGAVGTRVADLLRDDAGEEGGSEDVPIIVSEGRSYPVETIYMGPPGVGFGELERAATKAVKEAIRTTPDGDVLCFLPGAAEINRVVRELQGELPNNVTALPLYGALSQEDQALALAPSKPGARRVVVSTPIAESSLTISGVKIVVDSGLCKTPRFDPRKGMTRLELTRISRASADQRRGRAGRVAPGVCYRLWSESMNEKLAPDTTPEILQADLAPVALDLATWGIRDANELAWLDPPPEGPLIAARRLLRELGALSGEDVVAPSALGRVMSDLPLHPRMGRMLLFGASRGAESARLACQIAAVLGERDLISGRDAPLDVRCRLRALWGQDPLGSLSTGMDSPTPSTSSNTAAPTRVSIDTKLPKGGKRIKGAPRGKRPNVNSAVNVATNGASGGSWNVDDRAVDEAKKVAEQLFSQIRQLTTTHPDLCATGVGQGDPTGPVWPFLCGAGESEVGLLLALAYPDRIAARKSRGGAFSLSGGGAASVGPDHKDDALLQYADKSSETLVIAELAGDGAGNAGARNDRVRVAAPIDRSCFDGPDGALFEALAEERDEIFWASASKSVLARRRLTVGSLALRELPLSMKDDPDATVSAMLDGIREMGFVNAFSLNQTAKSWLRRSEFVHRSGVDPTFPDVSEESLLRTAPEWLAPWIGGATSKSDLSKIDVMSLIKAQFATHDHLRLVENLCPATTMLPSGTKVTVDYEGDVPIVAAKIQEFYGLVSTPLIGGIPCELHLLSPAGRPQAITRDIASFWAGAYVDIAKELRGRYPKHFWPDDPANAKPTSKTKKFM